MPRIARRTPKVFNSNYAPKAPFDWAQYRSVWPLGVLLLIVLAFYVTSQLPAFRVRTIDVTGQTIPELSTALGKLKGSSLLSSSLHTNITRIKNSLPALETLDCRRGIPGTLKCDAGLRSTALFWKSGGKTFAIDRNGFVFAEIAATPGSVAVEDKSAAPVRFGQVVASSVTIKNFIAVAKALEASHLQLASLYISDTLFQCGAIVTGSTDPSIPFAAKSPISVLFTFDQPIAGQVATLVQILKDKHEAIHDHVDLRVAGTAYIQ